MIFSIKISQIEAVKKSYVVEEVVVVVVLQRSRFKKDDFNIFELKKLHSKSRMQKNFRIFNKEIR